jgi:hypothetical protein
MLLVEWFEGGGGCARTRRCEINRVAEEPDRAKKIIIKHGGGVQHNKCFKNMNRRSLNLEIGRNYVVWGGREAGNSYATVNSIMVI